MMFGSVLGNISGTVYFLYYQFAGIIIAMCLIKRENIASKLVIGSVFGSVLLHWLPVIFAFFFDFGFASHLLAALVLFPVFTLLAYRKFKLRQASQISLHNSREAFFERSIGTQLSDLCLKISRHRYFGILFLVLLLLWFYLLYTHNVRYDSDGSIYTGQCGYGDMNMHLGFITSIAVQKVFPPDYSIFPGVKLAYPFLSDSISSSLCVFGASIRCAYTVPMIFAFMQVVCAFYMIAYTFLVSIKKAFFSVLFYFFNGGLGFWYFISWSYEGRYHFADIFKEFYKTPTNLIDENIRWVNIIADMLLPQRATLFGYAILFPATYLLYRAVFKGFKEYFVIASILGGALPLIHTHSFLAFGLISAGFMLVYLLKRTVCKEGYGHPGCYIIPAFAVFMVTLSSLIKKQILPEKNLMPMTIIVFSFVVLFGIMLIVLYCKEHGPRLLLQTWGLFLAIVIILALPQLLGFTMGQVKEGGFVRGCFNWGNQGDPYIWFYIKNIGPIFILGVAALLGADKKIFEFSFPIYPIWFLAEMIAFAPNNYDNNKLLYVAYIFMCIIATDMIFRIYEKIKDIRGMHMLAALFILTVTLSGILTLGREACSKMQLYAKDQVELARWIEDNTEPDTVILTSDRHNNIISSMTGRNIVCGSGAFLYYHGINTSDRNIDVAQMFEHPESSKDLFEKYNVSYICYSPYEWGGYVTDVATYDSLFERAFEFEGTTLYRIK